MDCPRFNRKQICLIHSTELIQKYKEKLAHNLTEEVHKLYEKFLLTFLFFYLCVHARVPTFQFVC
jgi:hypothetical protein